MIGKYINSGDAVTIIGHSLGSVVAFDTVYYNSNKDWAKSNFLPANLITMGSPIALFSTVPDDDGQPKWRYDPKQTNASPIRLVHEQGVWYNFLDAQDLIGYPLNLLYKDKYVVEDILVQTGTLPLQAHTDYWKDKEIARIIGERLRLDYERLNG
jgi:surfactin synthase thioesterase subunit